MSSRYYIKLGERNETFEIVIKGAEVEPVVSSISARPLDPESRIRLMQLMSGGQIDLTPLNSPIHKIDSGPRVTPHEAVLNKLATVVSDLAKVDASDPRRGALLAKVNHMRDVINVLPTGGAR